MYFLWRWRQSLCSLLSVNARNMWKFVWLGYSTHLDQECIWMMVMISCITVFLLVIVRELTIIIDGFRKWTIQSEALTWEYMYSFPLKSRRDYTPLMIFRILLMKINGSGKEKKRILKFWSDWKMRNWSEQLVDKDQILLITAVTCLYTLFFSCLFHSQFSLPHP